MLSDVSGGERSEMSLQDYSQGVTVLCSSGRPSVGFASLLASASSGCMTQGPLIFRACRVGTKPLLCHLACCLSSASLFQSLGPGDSTGLAQIIQNHLLS